MRNQQVSQKFRRRHGRDGAADPGRLHDALAARPNSCLLRDREITAAHLKLNIAATANGARQPVSKVKRVAFDEVDHLRRNVEHAQSKRGDDPLVVLRQQAALIAKKRAAEADLFSTNSS